MRQPRLEELAELDRMLAQTVKVVDLSWRNGRAYLDVNEVQLPVTETTSANFASEWPRWPGCNRYPSLRSSRAADGVRDRRGDPMLLIRSFNLRSHLHHSNQTTHTERNYT